MIASFHQRRQRAIIFGILAGVVLLGALYGRDAWHAMSGPHLPGYAEEAPRTLFAQLPWNLLQQGKWERGKAPVVPPGITGVVGHNACLRGYLLPVPGGASQQFMLVAVPPHGAAPPVGSADAVAVTVAGDIALPYTALPVTAYGRLHVATGTDVNQPLYRIEKAVLVAERP